MAYNDLGKKNCEFRQKKRGKEKISVNSRIFEKRRKKKIIELIDISENYVMYCIIEFKVKEVSSTYYYKVQNLYKRGGK